MLLLLFRPKDFLLIFLSNNRFGIAHISNTTRKVLNNLMPNEFHCPFRKNATLCFAIIINIFKVWMITEVKVNIFKIGFFKLENLQRRKYNNIMPPEHFSAIVTQVHLLSKYCTYWLFWSLKSIKFCLYNPPKW